MNNNRMATNLFHVQLFIFLSLSWTLAASLSLATSQVRPVKRNPLSSVDLHSNPKLEDWDSSGSSRSSRSSGYSSDGDGDGGENNSVSSLEELENKLDLILDSETREKALLQHFLQTSSHHQDGNKGREKEDQDNGTGKSRSSEEALSTISKPRRPNPRRSLRHKLRQQQVHVRAAGETNGEGTITSTSLASQSPGPDRSRNRHGGPAAPAPALVQNGNSNSKDGNSESSSEMMGSLSMTQTPGTVDQELEFGKVMEDEEDGGEEGDGDEDAEGSSDSNSMKSKDKKKEEEDDYKLRLGGSHGERDDNGEDSSIIVKKLEENSKRMETMVVFLADLRNVLSEAVASQEKQVALRGEVVELREEIDYLRKEVQKLRTEQASHSSLKDPKFENKIHNDETTIQWLKESVKELRTGLQEVSSSVNVTGLVHLRQQWETEVNRVDGDLRSLRSDVESLKGNQARDDEAVLEIKGDIADLRTWHIKMGQKFLQEEQDQVITDSAKTEEKQWTSEKVFTDDTRLKLNFHLTDSVSNGKATDRDGDRSKDTHRNRHNRKLKAEMANMENIIKDVVQDQRILHKRIVKLEKKAVKESKQQYEQQQRRDQSQRSRRNLLYFNDQLSNEIQSQEKQETNGKPLSRSEYGASNTFRINNLEKTLADYGNTVQHISDKVASLNELRESSTQLFTALEALETKYDERLTEMQTGLARMEASVSSTSITNDELREQQNLQSRVMQSFKKDFLGTRDQVQTNHLRLATVQSQLLKWGLKTCSDLSAESIQNIKIASLENRLQDSVRSM